MSCNSCSMYNKISRRKLNPMAAMVKKVSKETGLKGKELFQQASKEYHKMKSSVSSKRKSRSKKSRKSRSKSRKSSKSSRK